MNRAASQFKNLSLRLLTHETKRHQTSEAIIDEFFLVFEKFRPQLASLMGNGGYRALLTRALALSRNEVPWLTMVRVGTDGTLEATIGTRGRVTTQQLIEGITVLLAQLIGLMVAFVGEKITLGVLREVWPNIKINDSAFDSKGTNENQR